MLSFYLSQHDQGGVDDFLADLDSGDEGLAWLAGGLCRPDDPLHGGFFDSLGLGAGGSPPLLAADVDGALDDVLASPLLLAAPGGVPEEDFDVDMFFADGAPDDDSGGLSSGASSNIMSSHAAVPLALPAASGQLADPCGTPDGASAPAGFTAPPVPARDVLDIVAAPDTTKPPLPAHDAVPAKTPTTPSTPSGCVSPVTSCETEAAASPASLSPLLPAWSAPRRKRHRPVTRRNPSWLPKSWLHSDTPPPALRATAASLEPGWRRNRQRQRACSHCSNTETPQWRAGPRGPGTLCNACGIRYKQNGALFAAYRPCTSPGFDSGKHSNRHRKVVKLMEKHRKELLRQLVAPTLTSSREEEARRRSWTCVRT
jgi:hypothetical protein